MRVCKQEVAAVPKWKQELRLLVNISKQSATASKPQAYPVTETKRWVKKIENMKIKFKSKSNQIKFKFKLTFVLI